MMNKAQKPKKEIVDPESYQRIPPQAIDLEKAVLGALMLEKTAYDRVSDIIKPESFYKDEHIHIYTAIRSLAVKNNPIDELTVLQQLIKDGNAMAVGGAYYLATLTNSVVSSANIETHARIIQDKYTKRETINLGSKMIQMGYDDTMEVSDMIGAIETDVASVNKTTFKNDFQHISDAVVTVANQVDFLRANPDIFPGVPAGFKPLDNITLGWQNTDLIILAARPSVGKTALALNLAVNAATSQIKPTKVGFFSLEMSAAQLAQRIISASSDVYLKRIKSGRMEDDVYERFHSKGIKKVADMPIWVDDTAGINQYELRAKARRMKKLGVGLIIIDYLQLMTDGRKSSGKNREQEISNISRDLKGLAKDIGLPVIALSQLSREVEKRSDNKPRMSDLRESGAIEQDADTIVGVYAPKEDDIKRDPSLRNIINVIIMKHRSGDLGEISLKFFKEIQLIVDLDKAAEIEGLRDYKPMKDIPPDLFSTQEKKTTRDELPD